jgi:hypothetical protein
MRRYLYNVLRAADILLNTLAGGRLLTISARLGRDAEEGSLNWLESLLYRALESQFPGHCKESWEFWKAFHNKDPEDQAEELRRVGREIGSEYRGAKATTPTRRPATRNTGGTGD